MPFIKTTRMAALNPVFFFSRQERKLKSAAPPFATNNLFLERPNGRRTPREKNAPPPSLAVAGWFGRDSAHHTAPQGTGSKNAKSTTNVTGSGPSLLPTRILEIRGTKRSDTIQCRSSCLCAPAGFFCANFQTREAANWASGRLHVQAASG